MRCFKHAGFLEVGFVLGFRRIDWHYSTNWTVANALKVTFRGSESPEVSSFRTLVPGSAGSFFR